MALKSPLMPSPNGSLSSAFSPYSDSPNSPAVPGSFNGPEKRYEQAQERLQRVSLTLLCRSSGPSESLAPPPSPYPAHVDPSPVDSNGTESTEIEDEKQDGVKSPLPDQGEELQSPDIEITSPQSIGSVRLVFVMWPGTRADVRRTVCLGLTRESLLKDPTRTTMHRSLSSTHRRAIRTLDRPDHQQHHLPIDRSILWYPRAHRKLCQRTRLRYCQHRVS